MGVDTARSKAGGEFLVNMELKLIIVCKLVIILFHASSNNSLCRLLRPSKRYWGQATLLKMWRQSCSDETMNQPPKKTDRKGATFSNSDIVKNVATILFR